MLEKIKSPSDLKALDNGEIKVLAAEIREKIVSVSAQSGGHLASNLGMVEATLALHRVFDCPRDSIVFDVGHQCYAHKLLTGRYEKFDTIRTPGGISGFTNRSESEYDVLTAGHSGSALPCALGLARAKAIRGDRSWTVAVIGDGSFTNGMVYETLNSCTQKDLRLIVVLNDNEMSISKNVGGMPNYFTRLRNSKRYFNFKRILQSVFGAIPFIGHGIVMGCYHIKEFLKHLLLHTNFFENMGLYYMGPVDGNDEKKMELLLREAKTKNGCSLIHMMTVKGKGYEPAEKRPDMYHFAGNFDPVTGKFPTQESTFSSVFGSYLCAKAADDASICAVTAAMADGTGLSAFARIFPKRFFDVGIAEECAATMCGGLAIGGSTPVLALYSTFMQRAYDQLLEDVALQNVHAVLAIDRAGLVGGDGVTHQGVYDVALLSQMPGVTLWSPETYGELKYCFDKCLAGEGLCAFRYPKGAQREYDRSGFKSVGEGVEVLSGEDCDAAILTYGRITSEAVRARELLNGEFRVKVVKLVKLLPLDSDMVLNICGASRVLVLEEGSRRGGIGEAVAAAAARRDGVKVKVCAVDGFLTHADVPTLEKLCGLDAASAASALKELMTE
ncbi:MAG: 1-deoxy-D-xylulose-5-phosphate synthase [Candidatus Avispirillum sp.]